jgi:dolichyl-diphosphooligosaccharide--protein glycosyltransferase
MSFGDGAKHGGPWLYPLALIHCTDSPAQAAGMIRFTTADQKKTFAANNTRTEETLATWSHPWYAAYPTTGLESLPPVEAELAVESMRTTSPVKDADLPDQYFVVSWENLRLAYWISYFGNWDLVTGTASPGRIQRLRGQIQFNTQKGLIASDRQTIPLDTLDIVTQNGLEQMSWPNGKGLHGILNQLSKEVYVMDTKIYRSMLVQMLIAPPSHFAPHFTLEVDHFPWARAYRVERRF